MNHLEVARTLGVNGTRLSGIRGDEVVGFIEVDHLLGDTGRVARHEGWADIGNLCIVEQWRRRGVASWLLGQAAEWLTWSHVDRLLDYASPDDTAYVGFLRRTGFVELTRTRREWMLQDA